MKGDLSDVTVTRVIFWNQTEGHAKLQVSRNSYSLKLKKKKITVFFMCFISKKGAYLAQGEVTHYNQ